MTTNAQHTPLLAAYNLRLDAKAFRENTVYDSEGDPIRLIANAQRMEAGADAIEALVEALEPFARCVEYIADDEDGEEWAKFRLLIKDYRRAHAAILKATGEPAVSLEYIRNAYGVPANKGQRVRYTGDKGPNKPFRDGTIIGASGAHLKIRMDGDSFSQPYHPTWELEYLGESQP